MGNYRTLKEIDGQNYISVQEHEEILSKYTNLTTALSDLQAAVGGLGNPMQQLVSSINKASKI